MAAEGYDGQEGGLYTFNDTESGTDDFTLAKVYPGQWDGTMRELQSTSQSSQGSVWQQNASLGGLVVQLRPDDGRDQRHGRQRPYDDDRGRGRRDDRDGDPVCDGGLDEHRAGLRLQRHARDGGDAGLGVDRDDDRGQPVGCELHRDALRRPGEHRRCGGGGATGQLAGLQRRAPGDRAGVAGCGVGPAGGGGRDGGARPVVRRPRT